MGRRRYNRRRRGSRASSIIRDVTDIAGALPWWGALLFGIFFFLLLYFLIPGWLQAHLAANESSNLKQAFEALYARRIHWFQWIGISGGLVGAYFAVRNYFYQNNVGYNEKWIVRFLARIFGRNLD